MAAIAQLRFSPLYNPHNLTVNRRLGDQCSSYSPLTILSNSPSSPLNLCLSLLQSRDTNHKFAVRAELVDTTGNGSDGIGNHNTGGGNSGRGWNFGRSGDGSDGDSSENRSSSSFGIIGLLLNGWRSRVAADPQFPFKVLMEEIVGVSSCVLGDMASRPNFGLNELDFVFSTLVVGSIMNFTLMYLLAPTMGSASSTLPAIFASCPKSHMFEPGMYNLLDRCGTFAYKGTVFAAVGFAAGLVGTAISNGLIMLRKKMDPNFDTPNKPPPPVLNAMTWATHMGISSNFRYQTLNGLEFLLAKGLPPMGFKASVVILRCLNNILGGVSFVVLARMTGSQKAEGKSVIKEEEETGIVEEKEKEKLVGTDEDYQSRDPTCK